MKLRWKKMFRLRGSRRRKTEEIIKKFLPKQLDIKHRDLLQFALQKSNLIVYDEIHGIKQNADIIYTLVRKLDIQQLATQASPAVHNFINYVKPSSYVFSLFD